MKAPRKLRIGRVRKMLALSAVWLSGTVIVAASPAHAQGPDDFLRDLNGIGIGNPSDSHNFDLVGFGNAICWRLYSGEAPAELIQHLVTESRSGGQAGLTPQQARAALGFAVSDLCPDAAHPGETH
ncbi:hypothetical protein A5712_08055 [Mycobacterium sp. E2327]|uniref:DUF732 domain-containing protein n=1 Tax=Mycobacterium sp. E2327 TaxID=1834132 RepID=UPI0007FDFDAA|nr:DUF732 domain-containing protein [Mycobacterium sp. E2327]OBI12180.1 hypothetical protein A5712_08055 [Mycobacterium sp. E2327]